MSNTVKVLISQDCETGDYSYGRVSDDVPNWGTDWVFEISEAMFVQWESSRLEWERVTKMLGELHAARAQRTDAERERSRLLTELQKAQAAYDAHITGAG